MPLKRRGSAGIVPLQYQSWCSGPMGPGARVYGNFPYRLEHPAICRTVMGMEVPLMSTSSTQRQPEKKPRAARAPLPQTSEALKSSAVSSAKTSGMVTTVKGKGLKMDPTVDPSNAAGAKTARLEARVTAYQSEILKHAAALTGRSISDFIVHAATEAAHSAIKENHIIALSLAGQKHFADAIAKPPEPTAALKRAVKLHKSMIKAA